MQAGWKQRKWQLLAAAAVLGGVWLFFGGNGGGRSPLDEVELVPVKRGGVAETVTAQGQLEPREYVDVGAQVSGQLKALHVEIGDTVKQGDLIAEIDPRVYEAQVEASEARLQTLQAQLAEQQAQIDFARLQYQRNQRLIKVDAVSQETLQDSETSLRVAEARVKSLKAQLEEAKSTLAGNKTNLEFTRIYAPISGTVVVETTKQGMTVNANQTAPVIVQLANLDVMTVRAQVAEADVMRLREGMDVSFTTLGNMERRWHGTVRQILPSPEIINDVVLYNALVDAQNEDRQLMTGMSTQMFFDLGSASDVLTVPASALGRKLEADACEEGQGYVVRIPMGKEELAEREVCIGLLSRADAEVLSGLKEGELVAIPRRAETAAQSTSRRMRGPRL